MMVKCSNNEHYRVTPVYGFVEKQSKSELTIIRLSGSPKKDKFVIQWAEVPDAETDPQAPFKAGAEDGEVILPVKAE
ncbi:unnamed protein product [Toxocara canis]|uniref:MSP domain-containing protein n=1 Tax=Toxocara canis TaxID=6265 RepID=A0A183U796_TOXCA|nr:unnamed protein product [Toxocara canis]